MEWSVLKHWVFYNILLVLIIVIVSQFPEAHQMDVSQIQVNATVFSILVNNLLFGMAIAIPFIGAGYFFLSFVWIDLVLALTYFNMPFVFWLAHLLHYPLELWCFCMIRSTTRNASWSKKRILLISVLIGISAVIEGVVVRWLLSLFIS